MVRGGEVRTAIAPGQPVVLWKDRAEMPCGCAALVGIRIDKQEWAVVASYCADDGHVEQMRRFMELYAASLEERPEDREAVVVAAEILSTAFNLEVDDG